MKLTNVVLNKIQTNISLKNSSFLKKQYRSLYDRYPDITREMLKTYLKKYESLPEIRNKNLKIHPKTNWDDVLDYVNKSKQTKEYFSKTNAETFESTFDFGHLVPYVFIYGLEQNNIITITKSK